MRAGERGGSPAALRGQERHCHRGDGGRRRRPPAAYGVGGLADGSVAGSEGRSPGVAPGLFGEGAVPSTEPRRMSGMPTAMPNVSGSPRMMTPRRTATSGLTYVITCLLYTSDAADEEDSVDLGGRRIIKKKKKQRT